MSELRAHDDFIGRPQVAVLATVRRDGRPHAVPMWYLYEDGEFVFVTAKGSQKHRNLEASPEVMLVLDRRTPPVFALMIEGRAELGPALPYEQRRGLIERYIDDEREVRRKLESWPESITVRVRPRRVVEYRGAAGGA